MEKLVRADAMKRHNAAMRIVERLRYRLAVREFLDLVDHAPGNGVSSDKLLRQGRELASSRHAGCREREQIARRFSMLAARLYTEADPSAHHVRQLDALLASRFLSPEQKRAALGAWEGWIRRSAEEFERPASDGRPSLQREELCARLDALAASQHTIPELRSLVARQRLHVRGAPDGSSPAIRVAVRNNAPPTGDEVRQSPAA